MPHLPSTDRFQPDRGSATVRQVPIPGRLEGQLPVVGQRLVVPPPVGSFVVADVLAGHGRRLERAVVPRDCRWSVAIDDVGGSTCLWEARQIVWSWCAEMVA